MFTFLCQDKEQPLEKVEPSDPFRLPIEYLNSGEIFDLDKTVAVDLELLDTTVYSETLVTYKTMYHPFMNPETPFEENFMHKWAQKYTNNTLFLKDTQQVILSVGEISSPSPDYEKMMKIWKDTQEDEYFLERYSYMELEMLKWVNREPSFLQAISIVNMGSPILSFLVPFVLFLMPFFIVKLQGHPVTFSLYLSVLKEISRNHFIGKMIGTAQQMDIQSILYLLILGGLYAYQIYQNYMTCIRFYDNISQINEQICQMQEYIANTTAAMKSFECVIKEHSTYAGFRQDLARQRDALSRLGEHIGSVRPFHPSLSKIGEIGSLLGCYYEIFSNKEYAEALKYSFSFHGYFFCLKGISENLSNGRIACATFDKGTDKGKEKGKKKENKALVIKGQYYPALIHDTFVTNDANLAKNLVITGPNAAGKTTFLKTTMLNIIFTQQFGCGFYSACSLPVPYTHLHSYLNIPDTSGRDSLFQAESRRCKDIIDRVVLAKVEERHFCIFDELYSGTNPVEATKSAYAFLVWLSQRENVDFVLTTHYADICARFTEKKIRIGNWQMEAIEESTGDISYTYKLIQGVSKIQGAIKVLREMDYPEDILKTISSYDESDELDES
jgi:hypothetical protein